MSEQPGQAPTELLRLEKTATETIVIAVTEWHGEPRLDIRTYYQNDAGESLPTRKGVSIPPHQVQAFAEAVGSAAARMGLESDGEAQE